MTVEVAEASLPVADEVASVVTAVAVAEVAAAHHEEADEVHPEDVELLAVEAVEVPEAERMSSLCCVSRRQHLIIPQQGHCRAPSPRWCLRCTRKGGSARHQELDPR